MKYAFNNNGILQDVVMTHPSVLFPSSYASQFIQVPDEAQNGWLWDGENATPPEVVVEQVTVVTPRQARIVLAMQAPTDEQYPHMLAQIEATFDALPEPDKTLAQITWEYSTTVERTNPLIAQVQQLIGYTDEQIDYLFTMAATF